MDLLVESRLDGECSGWDGDTIFKFINGQIWKQAEYRYKYFYKYNPKVRVWRDGSRNLLEVEGVPEKLPVIKVQG